MAQEWIYDISKTVCFSGHRREKLPDKGKTSSLKMRGILSMLYFEIEQSINDGYENFIVGGASGIDLMAAELIMQFIHSGKNIRLIVALPYPEFGSNYKNDDLFMRGNALETASQIITVSDSYYEGCYSKRNRFMVKHSSRLIAVVYDYKSGTGQTIGYAKKQKLDTKIIDAHKFSLMVDKCTESEPEFIEEETELKNLVKIYYNT